MIDKSTSYALNSAIGQTSSDLGDTEEERDFRLRYEQQLKKKRQCGFNNYYGIDELLEERRQVNQQQMKTPGRRGEVIKHEEINKEILRRLLTHHS